MAQKNLENESNGWIRVYRSLFAHEFADETWDRITAWMYLVSIAAFKSHDVVYRRHVYRLERGQAAIVMSDFGKKAKWPKEKVRRFFRSLVGKDMITISGSFACCILTISNYSKYQVGTLLESAVVNNTALDTALDTALNTATDGLALTMGDMPDTAKDTALDASKDTQTKNVFKNVLRKEPKTDMSPEVSEVLAYLNEKVKRNFKNPGDIPARLKDYSVEDCKTVIDKKCKEWLGTDLAKHLDPVTLFRPSNFDRYLNQVEGTGNKAIFKEWVKGHPDLDWHRFGEDNQYARACTYLLAFKAAEKSGQVQFEAGDLEAQQLAIQIKTEETQKSIRGGKR